MKALKLVFKFLGKWCSKSVIKFNVSFKYGSNFLK
jgi:hypothetical protein